MFWFHVHNTLEEHPMIAVGLIDMTRYSDQAQGRRRSWKEIEGGWELNELWFDAESSSHRSKTFIIQKDGCVIVPKREPDYHADETIRCYSIPEIKSMIANAGLEYAASFSARELGVPAKELSPETPRNIVVARKP